ncbi:hypothetical protein CFO_g5442 [Ceratocystis platani]|uniref:Uncharacterized protein n=1 Tax=Ceratocystis fimbriata f. sp. platani TaxID=88771 RepID=A0A0F8D7W3_CERFI|nr:hypothetical protein CFO_g5442 [Ceratocystis platani]
MKFSSFFFPVAVSFFGFSLASIIEDRGYEVLANNHLYGIRSPYYYGGSFCIDLIKIDPMEKAVSIYYAKNEDEPDHEDKLSLKEIYTALCEKEHVELNDISWLSFNVHFDSTTDDAIRRIRSDRKLGPQYEVKLVPSDEEWNWIVRTKYYQTLQQLTNKQVQSIIIRHRYRKDLWNKPVSSNNIGFSFLPLEDVNSEAGMPFDDEEQEAVIKALFDEELEY